MIDLIILIALIVGGYFLWALFLWLGARLMRVPDISYPRALAATLAVLVLNALTYAAFSWLDLFNSPLAQILVEGGIGLLLVWLVVRIMLRTSFLRAIGSWSLTLIPAAGMLAFAFLVLRPYVLGAYVAASHNMAPTILGPHQRGVCPHCGKTATVSFHEEFDELPERGDPDEPGRAPRERLGICPSCGTGGVVPKIDKAVHGADRFIMNRLLQPRRWDLVVFRYPPEPSNIYVMRLIGMPGEEVVIKDGGVWINGVRAEPPAEIAKLTYTASLPFERDLQGAPERPAKLKADEYFVLGDFALASSDSRFWGPVPAANVEGVATLIYWPPSRWRFFR